MERGRRSDHTRGKSLPWINYRSSGVAGEMVVTVAMFLGGGFGGPLEEIEGLNGFGGDRILGFLELVGDFEDAGGIGGESGNLFRCVGPVDGGGSWPEVVVFGAVVVVEMELGDAGFQEFEGFVDADVVFRLSQLSVTDVEADSDAVEVADA